MLEWNMIILLKYKNNLKTFFHLQVISATDYEEYTLHYILSLDLPLSTQHYFAILRPTKMFQK